MGVCSVKKNSRTGKADLDKYKTKVLDHEPTSKGMQSKKEEIDQKNNTKPANFNEKQLRTMLQKINNPNDVERQHIFNVKDNLPDKAESSSLIFMVDSSLLHKKNHQIGSMIYNIIKDFEEHFSKLNDKPLLSIISIILLSYSNKSISEAKCISLLDQDHIMKYLSELVMYDFSSGEIGALNSLSKISFQSPAFIFHFCGAEYDDEALYELEINTDLRDLVHNYEMIFLEKVNRRLEEITQSTFNNFTSTVLTINA